MRHRLLEKAVSEIYPAAEFDLISEALDDWLMKIVGLCGSLRQNSSNALLMKAARKELSRHEWSHFDLSKLPYFDPDQQYSEQTPEAVLEVRSLAKQADAIFVFTPEYAHGIPGVLKNAFEWIFHEGTQKKPVYVAIASMEGENTRSQLIEVLKTMDFAIAESQTLLIKGSRSLFGANGELKDGPAKAAFLDFCAAVKPGV